MFVGPNLGVPFCSVFSDLKTMINVDNLSDIESLEIDNRIGRYFLIVYLVKKKVDEN